MVNPQHLRSLVAIAEAGGFTAAGQAIGRSHSAVSLHIKALEEDLGTALIDRTRRPPVLTADGEALVVLARRLDRTMQEIQAIGQTRDLRGRLAVGIVPTVMSGLAPPALARLRAAHPGLGLDIQTALSGDLAAGVRAGDLDAALLTGPDLQPEDLVQRDVAVEPLVVIAPRGAPGRDDADLVTGQPFIWFSRKTWAGQQIERRLLDRGLRVRAAMEIDSLEAIEALVAHGLGVAVVPDRASRAEVRRVPFGAPQAVRRIVLMHRPKAAKLRMIDALHAALVPGRGAAEDRGPAATR